MNYLPITLTIILMSFYAYLVTGRGMCFCPSRKIPVCATNNRTYEHPCYVQCEKIQRPYSRLEIKCYSKCKDCPFANRNPYPWVSGKSRYED